MNEEEVLYKLCYYDERHPDYNSTVSRGSSKETCACDNCFYGRTELALEILRSREHADIVINKILNKALIGKNSIKSPDSNKIAQFIIDYFKENDK